MTVPDLEKMEVDLRLEHGDGFGKKIILRAGYIKTESSDALIDRRRGKGAFDENNTKENPDVAKNEKSQVISIEKYIHSSRPPKSLKLYVNFTDSKNPADRKNDVFKTKV